MTEAIEGIILGVLGNVATTTSTQVLSKTKRLLIGNGLLEKWQIEETALQPILRKAANAMSEMVNSDGPARMEEVCLLTLATSSLFRFV